MSRKAIAPGPRGSLVMGNLAAYKRNPVTMLLKLQQQYGDVVRNRLRPFVTHALAHPDGVQHVLQDNHRNYVRGRFYDNFRMFFGDGLLTTDGEFWRRHRRVVQPLFHRSRSTRMRPRSATRRSRSSSSGLRGRTPTHRSTSSRR